MVGRFWLAGALITSWLGAALMGLLVFMYLRTRSRFILAYSVMILGAMLHLIGEISRSLPVTGTISVGWPMDYAVFATMGTGIITFAMPSVAMELVAENRRHPARFLVFLPAVVCAAATGIGTTTDSIVLTDTALGLEGAVGMASAVAVLLRRRRIHSRNIRHIGMLIAGICLAVVPVSLILLIMEPSSQGFSEGSPAPPISQLILMFLVVTLSFFTGSRELVNTARLHQNILDPVVVDSCNISARERDIIILIADGRSNEEIAARLYISESTVKNHIYHVFRKVGTHNRVELLNAVMKENKETAGRRS